MECIALIYGNCSLVSLIDGLLWLKCRLKNYINHIEILIRLMVKDIQIWKVNVTQSINHQPH